MHDPQNYWRIAGVRGGPHPEYQMDHIIDGKRIQKAFFLVGPMEADDVFEKAVDHLERLERLQSE